MFMEHIGSRYEGMQDFAQQMFKVCHSWIISKGMQIEILTRISLLVHKLPWLPLLKKSKACLPKLTVQEPGDAATCGYMLCYFYILTCYSRALEKSCHTFFIELVSQLCFGHELPNQDLVRLLFDTVFKSRLSEGLSLTRQLSYKEEDDSVPVIRSSLLQLLLKHR